MEGVFISDRDGKAIEVTDFEAALAQAKGAITFHETKLKLHETNPDEIIFPEAYKDWQHILRELEKLGMRLKKSTSAPLKSEPTPIINFLPEPVLKCRELFKNHDVNQKGFIKDGKISPLFGVHSCAKSDQMLRKIDELEIGESVFNSGNTQITRVF
jgi:hypothetical protein